VCLAALFVLSVVSRLPQLRSPNLLVDGDEATVGLMAKHFAQGKEVPAFFYGQHYGLSTVEAAFDAVSFRLFGTGDVSLKSGILALWTTGVLFLFLALAARAGRKRAFWIAAVLVLTPAWAVWSMKARGGYLASFAATGVFAWMLTLTERRRSLAWWVVAGALTALIELSQPLWLPGLLPFVAAALIASRRWACVVAYVAVATAGVLLIKHVAAVGPVSWDGPSIGNPALIASLPEIAHQIFVNLTGSYYLWWEVAPPGHATTALAYLWCLALPGAALVQIYRLITRRYHLLSHLLFVSVCGTLIAEWLLLSARDARYLLPISVPVVVLGAIDAIDLVEARVVPRWSLVAATIALLLTGGVAMREFSAFSFLWKNPPGSLSEKARLDTVIGNLRAHGVTRAFVMNGLLNYQIMFYSDEQVLARWTDSAGRYPAYGAAVDAALARGDRVAVVGYLPTSGVPGCEGSDYCNGGIEKLVPDPSAIITVDGRYFVYLNARRELLAKLGFQLPD
jgi:hypothetical protein